MYAYADHPRFSNIIERVRCEKDFYYFVQCAWSIIDPDEFIPTWHIECLCRHAEAFRRHEFNVADINLPPGHAKSMIFSVLFPVWIWITEPQVKILSGSHNMQLAIRDTLKSRRLIESRWFQEHWGGFFQLTSDQNTKSNYENDKLGYRIAFSTTGGATGLRGDYIILDDALSEEQSRSDVERDGVNKFLRGTLFNRQNIAKATGIIGVGQRFHPLDYHAVLLSLPGCFHLTLPEEYIPEESFVSPYYSDPRKEALEPLWNIKKFNKEGLQLIKEALGSHNYTIQYQQKAVYYEGAILKRSHWQYYRKNEIANTPGRLIHCWDIAAKQGKLNDYSVCLIIKKIANKFYLIDMYRKKVEFPQLKRDFVSLADRDSPQVIYIEDASNGTPLISEMRTTTYGRIINPPRYENGKKFDSGATRGRDKMARLLPVTPIIEAGNVLLPENAEWLETFISECAAFPNGQHDDIVDPLSMTLNNERNNYTPQIAVINF